VAVVALVGGYRPAILAAALGYASAAYLFIDPRYEFGADTPRHVIGFFIYLLSCAIIIASGEVLRAARRRAEAAAGTAEEERERPGHGLKQAPRNAGPARRWRRDPGRARHHGAGA